MERSYNSINQGNEEREGDGEQEELSTVGSAGGSIGISWTGASFVFVSLSAKNQLKSPQTWQTFFSEFFGSLMTMFILFSSIYSVGIINWQIEVLLLLC